MRKALWGALSILLFAGPSSYSAPQQESVAEAARRAREQKKAQPKPGKVITNDDLPATSGGISIVGIAASSAEKGSAEAETEATGKKAGAVAAKGAEEEEVKGEAYWRTRFAEARRKLHDAERELNILQRELNLKELQYYSDPNKALREQYDRKEINSYRQKIADKQREVEQLRQALSDLEDELRRTGGDPGWAREP